MVRSVQFALAIELLGGSCRNCTLGFACHHDGAVLLGHEHLPILLDALRAHRTRVDPWHVDKLEEIRDVITALLNATDHRRARNPFTVHPPEDIDGPDLADAAE